MLNVFLCGRKYFGHLTLKMLAERGVNITGVCTKEDDRTAVTARNLRIKHFVPSGQLRAESLPDGTDLIISAHSYDFIGQKTLQKARLGGIGYHPSLLPLHRGRDAIRWTIRMGDRVTGGTVYWLSKICDGGDIAAQDYVILPRHITEEELWRGVLQPMGLRLFERTLDDLERGRIVRVPQDSALATWEPSLDAPPVYRPELPQLGEIPGFKVVTQAEGLGDWRQFAGG